MREKPDLVFLDVQMPGQSGFDVIEAVGHTKFPHVIFVTAHDHYAIRAFDVNALDYLLKPIDDERFDIAFSRARDSITRDRYNDPGSDGIAHAHNRPVGDGETSILINEDGVDSG